MSQLPVQKISQSKVTPTSRTIGSDSVQDKMVRNNKADTLSTNLKTYKTTVKDNARRGVENAAGQTVRQTVMSAGGSANTAGDVVEVLKYGKNAKDSLLNLATKGVDGIFGTNLNGILQDIIPDFRPTSTEPAPAGLGVASPNSIAARINMRSDPLMNFHWAVQLPQLPTLPNLNMDIFNFYVEDVTINLPFFSPEPVFRNGTTIYYPRFSDAGSLTLTFYEDDNLNSTAYLQAWNYLIQDPNTGFYNRPSFYKKPIIVTPYDSCNIPCGTFYVDRAWPSQRQPFNFTSGTSEATKITCDFALNRIYYEPNPNRAAQVAAVTRKSNTMSSPNIKSANILDIIKNPIEFGKTVIGMKSNSPIKF